MSSKILCFYWTIVQPSLSSLCHSFIASEWGDIERGWCHSFIASEWGDIERGLIASEWGDIERGFINELFVHFFLQTKTTVEFFSSLLSSC